MTKTNKYLLYREGNEGRVFENKRELAEAARSEIKDICGLIKEYGGNMSRHQEFDIEERYEKLAQEAIEAYLENADPKEVSELPTTLIMLIYGDERKKIKDLLVSAMAIPEEAQREAA
ncbi:hypothetical protein JW758_02645 [Candidatus Peregrinibacteria bacterium]|nr:hypothetical protein [Candidatus Peregrinibacteria bacterium]